MQGRVKFHRKITEREWYSDANTFRVFFHLITIANHKDWKRQGIDVKRWQTITSIDSLAEQIWLTSQKVRTAMDKLISTWEIAKKTTNRNTIVTVLKYCDYNHYDWEDNKQITSQITNKQQTDNKQITTNKNDKNEKNKKELKESNLYIKGVEDFILFQKNNIPWINYQIEKQWEEDYLQKQYQAYNKIISTNKITPNNLDRILDFVKQDKFWNKQIGSITKLLDKNKEWVPYWVVMIDKIKTKIDDAPKVFKIAI